MKLNFTTYDIYEKIYSYSQKILYGNDNSIVDGINFIIDIFIQWEEEKHFEVIDEFLHQIDLRKVHHELISCIQDRVNESKLPLKRKRGFNKRSNFVLKKIDDFREEKKVIGINQITIRNSIGCKDNEIFVSGVDGNNLLKKNNGCFTKEELEEIKNRIFISEIQES